MRCNQPPAIEDMEGWCRKIGLSLSFGVQQPDLTHGRKWESSSLKENIIFMSKLRQKNGLCGINRFLMMRLVDFQASQIIRIKCVHQSYFPTLRVDRCLSCTCWIIPVSTRLTSSYTRNKSFAVFVSARQKKRLRTDPRTDGPTDRRTDGHTLL